MPRMIFVSLFLFLIVSTSSELQYGMKKIKTEIFMSKRGLEHTIMVPVSSAPEKLGYEPFRQNNFMRMRLRSNGCSCHSFVCGCCLDMNIPQFNYQRTGCMNMTIDAREFSLVFDMLWDNESIFQHVISGKNPPPMCIPLPVPYIPSLDACVQLFQISVLSETSRVHACIDMDLRIQRAKVLVLHFDCLQVGANSTFLAVKPTLSSTDYINE